VGTLHEDARTIMTISVWVLLRIQIVADKSCREKQNTHFVPIFSRKRLLCIRKSGKIW